MSSRSRKMHTHDDRPSNQDSSAAGVNDITNSQLSVSAPPTRVNGNTENDGTLPADGDRGNETNNNPGNANNGSQRAFQQTTPPPDNDTKPPAKKRGSRASRARIPTPPPDTIEQPPILPPLRDQTKHFKRPLDRGRKKVHHSHSASPPLYAPVQSNRPSRQESNGVPRYLDDHRGLNRHRSPIRRRVPSSQRKGRNTASTAGNDDNIDDNSNDGDDEDEGDDTSSAPPETDSPATPSPNGPIITTTEQSPSTPSRPITRSQTKLPTTSLPSPDPSTTPSPKRNRDAAFSAPPSSTVALGDRCSKRQRNSVSESSPLPEPLELERTRSEQKKFEEKLGKDHVFDPLHAGSVRRKVTEAKSGPKEWKKETLHQEPWDGSKEQ